MPAPNPKFSIAALLACVLGVAISLGLLVWFLNSLRATPEDVTVSAIGETYYRIHLYAIRHGELPQSIDDLKERPGYSNRIHDAWNRRLEYSVDGNGVITLLSFGRDGQPGGTGADQDILQKYDSFDSEGKFIVADNLWIVTGERILDRVPPYR